MRNRTGVIKRVVESTWAACCYEENSSNCYHAARNACLRVLRRELGVSRHGHAPEEMFLASCAFAHDLQGGFGWKSVFSASAGKNIVNFLEKGERYED